jgi:hypothetical protein
LWLFQERIDIARTVYLVAIQRELANLIIDDDLEAFEKAFYWMRDWKRQIGTGTGREE